MSDRDKQLNKGELIDIKSLIGDADGGDFSLDDIIAEFGGPAAAEPPPAGEDASDQEERFHTIDLSKLQRPPARAGTASRTPGKVVAFPGPPPEDKPEPPPPVPPQASPAPVIPFPQEENVLTAFVKDLNRKADDYANHMFEEDESIDKEEVRRLERLIPGTDL